MTHTSLENGFESDASCDATMATYLVMRRAILSGQHLVATVGGERREIYPHLLGRIRRRLVCVAYLGGGQIDGRWYAVAPEWRLVAVRDIKDIVVEDGPWRTAVRDGFGDDQLHFVDVAIDELPAEAGFLPLVAEGA